MTRVAPLAPPWSAADAADIESWGHPDRSYEPLLLVATIYILLTFIITRVFRVVEAQIPQRR